MKTNHSKSLGKSMPWLFTLLFLSALQGSRAEISPTDWPQWRGPARDGTAQGPTWPGSFSNTPPRQLWRVELGPSYSGPITWSNLVFTTETVNKTSEVISAYDRNSGERAWKTEWPGALSVPFFAKSNGDWIRSTPACDGERLFVAGMRDVLVCLGARRGRELWQYASTIAAAGEIPDAIFLPTSTRGRELAAMLAIDLNSGVLVDVTSVELSGDKLVVTRPIYSGKILQKETCATKPQIVTLRGRAFPKPQLTAGKSGEIKKIAAKTDALTSVEGYSASEGGVSLTDAGVIVSGGRGVSNNPSLQPPAGLDEKAAEI